VTQVGRHRATRRVSSGIDLCTGSIVSVLAVLLDFPAPIPTILAGSPIYRALDLAGETSGSAEVLVIVAALLRVGHDKIVLVCHLIHEGVPASQRAQSGYIR